MKSPALLLCLPLLACDGADPLSSATSSDKSSDEPPALIAPDITIDCASDDTSWCETLAFDGSALRSPTGKAAVEWSWSIDGTTYSKDAFEHTFEVYSDDTLVEFEGAVKIIDAAGDVWSYSLDLAASVIEVEDDEGSITDTWMFWFTGASPMSAPGSDCLQRIIAVSGCFTSGFGMEWLDNSSQIGLMSWSGAAVTYSHAQYIYLPPPPSPTALVIDLQLPSPLGEVIIEKQLPAGGQHVIRRTLSCTPADPRG